MTAEIVVETTDFSYRYGAGGGFPAVSGLNLAVQRGELYALLGTNGAGKTTTLETIEGHRRPTSGRVSVLGGDPTDRRGIRPRLGIMLQDSGFGGPDRRRVRSARRQHLRTPGRRASSPR